MKGIYSGVPDSQRRWLSAGFVFAVFGLCCSSIDAQNADQQMSVTLRGREIPYYYLVRTFFQQALLRYEFEDPRFYRQFIERVGFELGSPQEQALTAALELFRDSQPTESQQKALGEELSRLVSDETAYWQRVNSVGKEKAGKLGDLYRELEESLVALGSSMDGIRNYIDHTTAPGATLTSDKPLDERFSANPREFEKHAERKPEPLRADSPDSAIKARYSPALTNDE